MAVKLADTLAPMGDFPAAKSNNIEITLSGGAKKSIQDAYDDGDLGGGGGVEQTYNPNSEKAQSGKAVAQAVAAVNPLQMKYPDGKTWQNADVTSSYYYAFGKTDDGTLVVGASSGNKGIKYSVDNGRTWQDTNVTLYYYYAFEKADDGTLVAGGSNAGIKYSPLISFKDWVRKVTG